LFGKTASPTTSLWMAERNEGESWNKLLFSASSHFISLRERKKNSFTYEAILAMGVWQENSSQQL